MTDIAQKPVVSADDVPLTRRALREAGASAPAERAAAESEAAESETDRVGRAPRGLLSFLGTAAVAVVLSVIAAIGIAAIVVPAATGSTPLTVLTSSMEPTMPAGTLVVVRPTAPEDITPGTVLTYQLRSGEAAVVTHRVQQQLRLADGSYTWITQGDANPSPDPDPVREVQARGTVWYAIPYVGWVTVWLSGDWRAWALPLAVVGLFGYAAVMVIGAVRDRARRRAPSAGRSAGA